jgi:short-subunit dehydrogenase
MSEWRSALITGAANGIGKELALLVAKKVENLVLFDLDDSEDFRSLSKSCESAGARVQIFVGDVRSLQDLQVCLDEIGPLILELDLVIANAGISPEITMRQSGVERVRLMETNYYGVANLFEILIEKWSRVGRSYSQIDLVAMSSISSLVSTQNSGTYSASKAALSKYLSGLRLFHFESGLRVHEVVCGFVNTRVNVGLKHAGGIMIEPATAAEKILGTIQSRTRRRHSIPFFRNSPWFILSVLPPNLRDKFLVLLYKKIYKKH